MLSFRDSFKSFKLDADLLKTVTIYNFIVSHSNPHDQKLTYEFAKETKFDIKPMGRKSDRDKSLKTVLKAPAITVSEVSKLFLPENAKELCDRIKLLLQEKQAGNNSNISEQETFAIVDEPLD